MPLANFSLQFSSSLSVQSPNPNFENAILIHKLSYYLVLLCRGDLHSLILHVLEHRSHGRSPIWT
ncbi:hypothetical protein IC575_010003 [Cucumis melo]